MEMIWLIKGRFMNDLRVCTRTEFTSSDTQGPRHCGTPGQATSVHSFNLRRWETPAASGSSRPQGALGPRAAVRGAEPRPHPGSALSD